MSEEGEFGRVIWVCYDCLSLAESYEHVMNPAGTKVSKTTWEQEVDADGNVKHTAGCSMCGIPKRAFLVKGIVVREKGESIPEPPKIKEVIDVEVTQEDVEALKAETVEEEFLCPKCNDIMEDGENDEDWCKEHGMCIMCCIGNHEEPVAAPLEKESEIARLEAELAKLKSGEA